MGAEEISFWRSNIFKYYLLNNLLFFLTCKLISAVENHFSLWPAGCCCCSESEGFAGTSASSARWRPGPASPRGRLSHLLGPRDWEEAESSGKPLSPGIRRQEGQVTQHAQCNHTWLRPGVGSRHHTCKLFCGCSTREWLSPVDGLLEGLVLAGSCGLSTTNGGSVPSLKCRGISEGFFSWSVRVMSNSHAPSCGTNQPLSMTDQK